MFHMVVVGLHQDQFVTIFNACITKCFAGVLAFQIDDQKPEHRDG
jgi:hypothetical protein